MWQENDSVFLYSPNGEKRITSAIAGFDLDGTLIQPINGSWLSVDFILTYDSVISKLKEIQQKNYTIVIFSNQKKFTQNIKVKIQRFGTILENMAIPAYILVSKRDDMFRKPQTGMFKFCLEHLLNVPDMNFLLKNSFFVGDAVGDSSTWPPYKWSDSDKMFAEACGITFYTPNTIFPENTIPKALPSPGPQELIINVGNPGSGKTFFTTKFINSNKNYVSVCQDVLKTKKLVISETKRLLTLGNSVIIDRMNQQKTDRQIFIQIAKDFGIHVRIWWFSRDGSSFNNFREKHVDSIVYGIYSKQFERPTTDEAENLAIERIN